MNAHRPAVAIVGLGVHAHSVLLPCLTMAGARIAAVHDVKPDHLHTPSVADDAWRASTLTELLDHAADLDAAVIAAPAGAALAAADAFVERRIPVFVEKPVSLHAAEVRDLAARASAAGTVVQVGFNRRFAPAYRQLRGLLSRAGAPVAVTLRLSVEAPGGLSAFLRDAAIHQLDLCSYLLNGVREVAGYRADDHDRCFVNAVALCRKGVANLQLSGFGSWGWPSEQTLADMPGASAEVSDVSRLTLHRSGRQAAGDDQASRLDSTTSRVWQANLANPRTLNNSLYLQGYLGELQQFLKAAVLGAPASPGPADAADALDLADRLMALPTWSGRQ